MTKHILPLVALLLLQTTSDANAQSARNNALTEARAHRWDLPLAGGSAEKNTDIVHSRLVKSAWGPFANGGFMFKDSSDYLYSHDLGEHVHIGWMYDTMITVTRYPNTTRNSVRSLHTFGTMNRITDQETQWWDSTNSAWFAVGKLQHTYSGIDLLSTVKSDYVNGAWTPILKTEYYTNWTANTKTTLLQTWDAAQSKWVYDQREVTMYNSMNWEDTIKKEKFVGSAWVAEKITAFTNTTRPGTLIERFVKVGSAWVPEYKETNTYNGSGHRTESEFQTYNQLAGIWNDPMKEEYTYDLHLNPTETVTSNWVSGAYQKTSREVASYNKYDQLLISTMYTWDANFSQWIHTAADIEQRNYYKEYVNMAVSDTKSIADVSVYPVPASNMLNVETKDNQSSIITITDMLGKAVKNVQASNVPGGVVAIDVQDMPAGVYLLRVDGSRGTATKRISIVR
ncbi:MAG: T9SS type A sorting domain-containing protein [Sphingobacteriales bacterium]|nr:MAG: T9SS type A sorting domain-containing protein [Sphingobacteriales bacterium]